jgi:hypothetical protein
MTAPDEETPLTEEQRRAVRDRFDRGDGCKHCGGIHARACPRVRRLAYHSNDHLAEVEFWRDDQWSKDHIIWPEDTTETGGA